MIHFGQIKFEITLVLTIKVNKYEKGEKNTKIPKSKYKSETEVITRRPALQLARLKKFGPIMSNFRGPFFKFLWAKI